MQVIENTDILDMIGGGGAANIKCSVSNKGVSCEGSLKDYAEAVGEGFDKLQTWGGNFGCWLYDRVHGD